MFAVIFKSSKVQFVSMDRSIWGLKSLNLVQSLITRGFQVRLSLNDNRFARREVENSKAHYHIATPTRQGPVGICLNQVIWTPFVIRNEKYMVAQLVGKPASPTKLTRMNWEFRIGLNHINILFYNFIKYLGVAYRETTLVLIIHFYLKLIKIAVIGTTMH